jgi:hypothetical protein
MRALTRVGRAVTLNDYLEGVICYNDSTDIRVSRRQFMNTTHITTVKAQIPTHLAREAEALVAAGWAKNFDALLAEALYRYLDTHRPELVERFVREDVEWGLHGRD